MNTKEPTYHKLTVTMKNGFTYSVVCGTRQLKGMISSSEGYWTEKVEVTDISTEEYRKYWWNEILKDTEDTEIVSEVSTELTPTEEAPRKKSRKKKIPKFADLEDFFESSEPAPKNKKLEKRV